MAFTSRNPATGAVVARYQATTGAEIARALGEARQAFGAWSERSVRERATALLAVAGRLRAQREGLARLMAIEMGKPVTQGRGEVDKCALVLEHYAAEAETMLASEAVSTEASRSFVAYRPLGTVLAIMPWNFPLWQVFRFAAPTLMAGNTVLMKHASNVCGCSLAIHELFEALPAGVFRSLLVDARTALDLVDAPEIAAVTLTGSTAAGRAVAARAGAALKKSVMELGGSDPVVILADADLDLAAETCAKSRLLNAGQSCISAKRFIVLESVREEFERRLVLRMEARHVGDPQDDRTDMGPLARADLREEVLRQVRDTTAAGASVALGGEMEGCFVAPTVLGNVRPGMAAFDEEVFGPVAAVIAAADEADAIRLANASRFGLGASVFTRDTARGQRIATFALEAGSCFVNDLVRSDPRVPFGGIRESGYGRELGTIGIREFVNVKTVWVR